MPKRRTRYEEVIATDGTVTFRHVKKTKYEPNQNQAHPERSKRRVKISTEGTFMDGLLENTGCSQLPD